MESIHHVVGGQTDLTLFMSTFVTKGQFHQRRLA